MDLHSYPQKEHRRFEKILNQFLLKSLHIILDSRVPAHRSRSWSGEVKKSDKWFNLILGDHCGAMDNLSFWNRSLMEPMVIDVTLVKKSSNSLPEDVSRATLASKMLNEIVVERWIVKYEHQSSMGPKIGDVSYKKTYKKLIILLRSVYSVLRLLPAYKAFRKLSSLNQNFDFDINYKVCSFGAPFSKAEKMMKGYKFFPVEALQGRLSVSVIYREDLSDFNLDAFVLCPPEIITDYIGSPLTELRRSFPSTSSEKGVANTSFPARGRQSASSLPFSSQQNQPFLDSPPLNRPPYDYSSSHKEICGQSNQNKSSSDYRKAKSEDLISPSLSSSPPQSPPTDPSGGNPLQSRLYSETAPLRNPPPMMGRSARYLSCDSFDLHRLSPPPLSHRNTKHDPSSGESPSTIRPMRNLDSLRAGGLSSDDGQEVDSGRPSSSGSPHVGFSRSSRRLTFRYDFGDCDFSAPFIVDDADPCDSQARQNLDSTNASDDFLQTSSATKKSQDVALGAVIHMLTTAPPLHQDPSCYTSRRSKTKLEGEREAGAASELFKVQKTSDALQELKAYREMKDVLLSKTAAPIGPHGEN